jgi:phosphatidylglycerol---prolipoprotein diacylglyceryl transferase
MVWHFIFQILSIMIALGYYQYLIDKKKSDSKKQLSDMKRNFIFISALIGAFIGSRLLDYFEHISLWNQSNLFIMLMGSKTIVGALLGGLVFVEITKRICKINFSTGDDMTFPLILGIIIGRIGCHIYGLHDATIGNLTNMPWGWDFGDGVLRHPTSLYEILFLIIIWVLLKLISSKHSLQDGALFKLFITSYLFYRFIIGFFQPHSHLIFELSPIQIGCILGLIYYYKTFLFPHKLILNKKKAHNNGR